MNTSKLLTGTIVGGIVGVVVGYLVFGLALHGFMADNITSMKDPPDFLWLILGHIVFAGLTTYIFLQWAGISTPGTGAKAGAIIGLLATLAYDWIYLATTDIFSGGIVTTLVDAIGVTVVWAIAGAVIGWVLGMGKSE